MVKSDQKEKKKKTVSRVEDYSFTEEHLRAHCASLETFKSRVRTENHSHKLGAKSRALQTKCARARQALISLHSGCTYPLIPDYSALSC